MRGCSYLIDENSNRQHVETQFCDPTLIKSSEARVTIHLTNVDRENHQFTSGMARRRMYLQCDIFRCHLDFIFTFFAIKHTSQTEGIEKNIFLATC